MLRRLLVPDALWTAGGQVGTALGTLIGVRILTEFVTPATFGAVSLIIGVSALTLNMTCTPLTQASVYLYPGVVANGSVETLRATLLRSLRRLIRWVVPVFALATAVFVVAYSGSPVIVALLAALLVCDGWRAIDMSFMNAARRHRSYAAWSMGEAWARPLAAAIAVMAFEDSAVVVLAAYLIASASLLAIFASRRGRAAAEVETAQSDTQSKRLDEAMWLYALPLIPIGLIGCTNGLADRYIIGGLLSVQDAGIYSAIYALASRPFLMLGQTVELVVRPVYQNAVSAGHSSRANSLLTQWFVVVVVAGLLGVAAITLWRSQLAALLVGEQYRGGADLMPWIAAGYWLLILSHVFTRVCFAYGRTKWVLAILISSAIGGTIATTVGALLWGLHGTAMAVMVCFAVQLAVSIVAAGSTYRQAHRAPLHSSSGVESA